MPRGRQAASTRQFSRQLNRAAGRGEIISATKYSPRKERTTPLFKRLFGPDEPEEAPDGEVAIEPAQDQSPSPMTPGELAAFESSSRSVTLPAGERVAAAVGALIPLAANAAQAANEFGLAVVKFPEGAGWADLCVRRSDGWSLLSSFKDGKFNETA